MYEFKKLNKLREKINKLLEFDFDFIQFYKFKQEVAPLYDGILFIYWGTYVTLTNTYILYHTSHYFDRK